MWTKLAALVGLVTALAAAAVGIASRRWSSADEELMRRLRASARPPAVASYASSELEGLPPPVARYFRAVLPEGELVATGARVAWEGDFNTGRPGRDRWCSFTARQEFVPGAPGFVWSARIAMAPGLPVLVRDSFVLGKGSMQGAVLGVVPVLSVSGTPELATAALQRYLGEAVWFPTALLPSQGVAWTPIDGGSARATLEAGRVKAALEFRFGSDGLVAEVFAPERSYDDGQSPARPRPWRARLLRYEERSGLRVPVEAVAEWLLPEGVFAYWRGRALELQLD